ncbi:hypothetical protein CPC08DRAFT_769531 [Agrocybe pediades]|nr:hypothetical protein CPC08DRAFT_769531 [Agrocybe pediades]
MRASHRARMFASCSHIPLCPLRLMPNLQSLRVRIIGNDSGSQDATTTPTPAELVFLPHLSHVHISTLAAWKVAIDTLDRLRPFPGFRLEFRVDDAQEEISSAYAVAIKHVFGRILQDVKEVNLLNVTIYDDCLSIDTANKFHFGFGSRGTLLPILQGMLCLPQSGLLLAKKLLFTKSSEDRLYDEVIMAFTSSLSEVESLHVDVSTLAYIHGLSLRHLGPPFSPLLKDIELSGHHMPFATILELFLDHRKTLNGSAMIQSLTIYGLAGNNLSNLERFNGLLVEGYFHGKRIHYVCGSGRQEILNFTEADEW